MEKEIVLDIEPEKKVDIVSYFFQDAANDDNYEIAKLINSNPILDSLKENNSINSNEFDLESPPEEIQEQKPISIEYRILEQPKIIGIQLDQQRYNIYQGDSVRGLERHFNNLSLTQAANQPYSQRRNNYYR